MLKILKNYTRQQVRDFYHKYYVPSNAVLVIAGDFNVTDVKKWLQKYYGKISSKPLERPPFPKEPSQTKVRKQSIEKEIQATYLSVSFQGAPEDTPDSYTLDVLGSILGGDSSSRLYRRLVHFNRASTSIYSFNYGLSVGGFFLIQSQLYPNHKPKKGSLPYPR